MKGIFLNILKNIQFFEKLQHEHHNDLQFLPERMKI